MGKIIPIPDIEYIHWCNTNKELIEEIMKTGRVNDKWFNAGNNKAYFTRYLKERGYTFTLD